LGFSALYYLFRSYPSPAIERESLYAATWLISLHWFAQLSGALYPGSLPVDPEFGEGFPQVYICAVLFGLIGVGMGLEIQKLNKLSVNKGE
jgi:hypothetical protein